MLWAAYGAKDAGSAWLLMQSRAHAVMSAVTYSGWDKYRTTCEEALEEARQLWVKSESLVVEVAETEIGSDKSDLLEACKELLEACDCCIAAEEEILELNNLSAQSYVLAHEGNRLFWQRQVK
jgi:hypothetical protein